jgi:hypothetical protein
MTGSRRTSGDRRWSRAAAFRSGRDECPLLGGSGHSAGRCGNVRWWKADIQWLTPWPMKITMIMTVAAFLPIVACSSKKAPAHGAAWVTASSLKPPRVLYTPKLIITARETSTGLWIWHPQKAPSKKIDFEQLIIELAAARSLRPDPLILFSFAHQAQSLQSTKLRARIASAAGCSSSSPCIEGTPEQLR